MKKRAIKKAKTPHHSTRPKKVTIKQRRREMDMELSLGTLITRPIPETRIVNLAKDLLLMIEENPKTMITLKPWRRKHKIAQQSINEWRVKYPKFDFFYTEAMELIADQYVEDCYHKRAEPRIVQFLLPIYSSGAKAAVKQQAAMKAQAAQPETNQIKIVEIPTFYPSGLVPPKSPTDGVEK